MEEREKLVQGIKNFFKSSSDSVTSNDDNRELLSSLRKGYEFTKRNWNYLVFIPLILVLFMAADIRTSNLEGGRLIDVTTGLHVPIEPDSFLFLRYAEYIVDHGTIFTHDDFRNYPLGYSEVYYIAGTAYFYVFLYNIANVFGDYTIQHITVLSPVISFIVGLIFFFLFVRRLFGNNVALLSSFLLAVVPTFLYRTMTGFADHDSPGMMFFFMAFYFYVAAIQSKKLSYNVLFGVLAGLATAGMRVTWVGGSNFIFFILGLFPLFIVFSNKVTRNFVYSHFSWFVFSVGLLLLTPFFQIGELILSTTTSIMLLATLVLIVDYYISRHDKILHRIEKKMPLSVGSVIISLILGVVVASILYGPLYLFNKVGSIISQMINPFATTRWALTVAESQVPYFTSWIGQFGGWIFILLFMIGSAILFYRMMKPLKKGTWLMTISYSLFIMLFVFSRYSASSTFNGVNFISKLAYVGSLISFIVLMAYLYFNIFYKDKDTYARLHDISINYGIIFVWFLVSIVGARGAIRLLFTLSPIAVILASYCIFELIKISLNFKQKYLKIACVVLVVCLIWNPIGFVNGGVASNYYKSSVASAPFTGGSYDQQWQEAMGWVRENTAESAIFNHWWDYGYYVQYGGQRATLTDGGNEIGYWNYLTGRHALLGQNETEALEFLYTRNVTHFLIVSEEIGKYGAFASIAGGVNYERYSTIGTFVLDPSNAQETRTGITHFFRGGAAIEDSFVYNGKTYSSGGVGAFLVPFENVEETINGEVVKGQRMAQPSAIIVSGGVQSTVPLKCIYYEDKFFKFEEGLPGCFKIIPNVEGNSVNKIGAGLYVSERGFNAIWTQLYLFEQRNTDYPTTHYNLAYSGQHPALVSINQQSGLNEDNVVLAFGRLLGPIKIWELNYPSGLNYRSEYLLRNYKEAGLEDVQRI